MNRVDLSGCVARLNAAREAWMDNYRAELRKKSWRDRVKAHPDRFKIERGYVWEKDPNCPIFGGWNAIMPI